MLGAERRNIIEKEITERGSVLVAELAKKFDVTMETIRADLEKLEKQGVLVRTYGGATIVDTAESDIVTERDIINYEGKQRSGNAAAQLVRDGETVFLDASTSALHMARCLKNKKGLTVITNAEKIVTELAPCENINVICVGGALNSKNMSFAGRVAQKCIRENYYANKFFFSCRGVTKARGLVDSSEEEAEIKKAMLDMSESAVFLCDRNKLGRLGVPVISGISRLDAVVTDVKLTEEWTELFNASDVRIITAE